MDGGNAERTLRLVPFCNVYITLVLVFFVNEAQLLDAQTVVGFAYPVSKLVSVS